MKKYINVILSKLSRNEQIVLCFHLFAIIESCAYLCSSNFTPHVKQARNQSQLFNRKSISRNITHRQSLKSEGFFQGGAVGDFPKYFSRGGKSGEICFLPLEIEKKNLFCLWFQNSGGPRPPLPPLPTPWSSVIEFATNANSWNVEKLKQGQRKQTTSRLKWINHTTPWAQFFCKMLRDSLVWNQYSQRVDAEVTFYISRFPILFVQVFWEQHESRFALSLQMIYILIYSNLLLGMML